MTVFEALEENMQALGTMTTLIGEALTAISELSLMMAKIAKRLDEAIRELPPAVAERSH